MNAKDPNIDFQTIEFSLANGESRDIFGPYNYFRIMSLTGADNLTVKFQDGSRQKVPVSVGIGFPDSKGEDTLTQVTIINESGSSITGEISIASGGEIQDSRATIGGTVSIKDVSDTVLTTVKSSGAWTYTPQSGVKNISIQATASGVVIGHDVSNKNYPIANGSAYDWKSTAVIYGTNACVIHEEYNA